MRPYNTRHKTLSLHSLGIHVPGTHASRAATASRTSPSSTNSASPVSMASPAPSSKDSQPPAKRQKRANSEGSNNAPAFDRLPKKRDDGIKLENTPPPSPPAARPSIEMSDDDDAIPRTIDMESINDEIVEAVIIQLQNTGNRPHLVKELATVLMQQLKIVQQYVPSTRLHHARCRLTLVSLQVGKSVRHYLITVSDVPQTIGLVRRLALPAGKRTRVGPSAPHLLLLDHVPAPAAAGSRSGVVAQPSRTQPRHHLAEPLERGFKFGR